MEMFVRCNPLCVLLAILVLEFIAMPVAAQLSSDPRLCGGYQRDARGYIDFKFNENTAPPGTAMQEKYCMWTISPSVPTEHLRFNWTIRNVNLQCSEDKIAINFFQEGSDVADLGPPTFGANPLCMGSHEVLQRDNVNGTTIVVILYVRNVEYGKGFYMEWKEGYESRGTVGRIRNTYYSFGRPSVEPSSYFAGYYGTNEISTFGFIKANYSEGYQMQMQFSQIKNCEGQGDWMKCFRNKFTLFKVEPYGTLSHVYNYSGDGEVSTDTFRNHQGFFFIIKSVNEFGAGGRFNMIFETIRG